MAKRPAPFFTNTKGMDVPMNILFRIKEKLPYLPESERKIAAVIIEDPTSIITLSASQLAERSESSSAAVIRLCRSLDVKGFVELKLLLSADSQRIQENVYTDILPGETMKQIKKKLLINATHVFNETNHVLEDDKIDTVIKILHQSSVIYAYGLGASYIVAQDFQQKFSRIGKIVVCSQDQHFLSASIVVADKNAVFIGFSNSGEKREVISLLKIAKKNGLKTISVTQDRKNSLASESDYSLRTALSKEAPLRSGATISLLMQMYALDILFYAYVANYYEASLKNIEISKQVIQELNLPDEEAKEM
ncbi:MAG: MurR/RpiR family transcriptional regulator [Pisciglobus halotolerans]|nr:MurR/RpiR family transcriptional regulator [Pisciglobus halotolerans]